MLRSGPRLFAGGEHEADVVAGQNEAHAHLHVARNGVFVNYSAAAGPFSVCAAGPASGAGYLFATLVGGVGWGGAAVIPTSLTAAHLQPEIDVMAKYGFLARRLDARTIITQL
jgi:hypothetical protein